VTEPWTPVEEHTRATNQAPPLAGYDVFGADAALTEAVAREGGGWATAELHEIGRLAGDQAWIDRGFAANENEPVLRLFDRYGHRIDEVAYHPAWHELMTVAVEHGLHAGPWRDPRPGAHVARAAALLVWGQVEAGHICPITMTYASIAALRVSPELAAEWEPVITAPHYDFGLRPATGPGGKTGAIVGMAMTEKQGGSDLRSNITVAEPVSGDEYRLTGHKWFCSAPMSDAFLVVAQAAAGPTCFLLPRVLPDGGRNAFRLQRLKNKLGNRSNASSEIELAGATAFRVGDEGRGVATIARMVNLTRLDCVLGSAALIRQAVSQALHHARYRSAFGARLVDQPLMNAVLAELALESEASTALGLRLAGAVDRSDADDDKHETAIRRLGTAVGKYWVCKRGPSVTAEALECLGGNGYVEESIMPRLYREAPVNSVWEGSGNVNVLDVLRVLGREPATAEAFVTELERASGGDARLDAYTKRLTARLLALGPASPADAQRDGRGLVEAMAVAFQGALLVRHAPTVVAEAFCASRFGADAGWAFGASGTTLAPSSAAAIVERATPGLT
jgi:putative acyl-CoA dehydrogenase